MATDIWTYRTERELGVDLGRGADIVGFKVEALDGSIGKIDEATYDAGQSYIVVDTGPWILGRKVMLPAGVIDRIDLAEEKVYVHRTKDEIKASPEFDDHGVAGEYHDRLSRYYGPGGVGYRDWR